MTLPIPVSARVFGSTILDERLEPRHCGGVALILAGLTGRLFRSLAMTDRRMLIQLGLAPFEPDPALTKWLLWHYLLASRCFAFAVCECGQQESNQE